MSSTRADRRSGSLARLRPCMVMHVGNSGGSRAWKGMLGHRPEGRIAPPPVNGCSQVDPATERQNHVGRFGKGSARARWRFP